MTRLDWEKANRRERKKRNRPSLKVARKRAEIRRRALQDFVETHGLTCFSCNREKTDWAKTGISTRGPWAICTDCVNKRKT